MKEHLLDITIYVPMIVIKTAKIKLILIGVADKGYNSEDKHGLFRNKLDGYIVSSLHGMNKYLYCKLMGDTERK